AVAQRRKEGHDARGCIAASPPLARALELIEQGVFSPDDPDRFRPLVNDLRSVDHFLITADFAAYEVTQRSVDREFDGAGWQRKSVLNTANMGWFSSDRTIREYAGEIWRVPLRR